MKKDLVINFVPIEIPETGLTIHFSDTTSDNHQGTYRSVFLEEENPSALKRTCRVRSHTK
jgi:hypothetical protein